MQNRISRLRALNALADAMIDLKVALLEIEGVGLQYRPVTMATDGGPGSGNFNHAGRPGEVGGSAPSDGGSGSSSASTGRPGTISMKSEDFGKPGKYTLYRNGIVKNNGMIFFAVKKEYADTYADDESKGGAEQKTDEFVVSIERPLIIKGATDVQCIRLAYEAMNPGKKAVSINKFSNSHWMRYDKENEKALSAPGSQYDSIIYIINGRPKEVQISGNKAKSDAVKTGEYTTTAWSRLGWNMEEAKERGYFDKEPNDYTYKPLTNDRMSVRDGGEGSGNFGHAGRPGEVGGSAPRKMGQVARPMLARR